MQYDPLLATSSMTPNTYNIPQLEEEQQKLIRQVEEMKKNTPRAQNTSSPVWDEIENITSSLSDREFQFISNNDEFRESTSLIQAVLQREYMRIMRPVVESTKDGKDILEKHLTLLKRLRKSAADEVNKKYNMLDEYIDKYSNMPFDEYLSMKKNGGKKK